LNFSGCFKNSTNSVISNLAWSYPATSLNLISDFLTTLNLAPPSPSNYEIFVASKLKILLFLLCFKKCKTKITQKSKLPHLKVEGRVEIELISNFIATAYKLFY